MRQSYIDLRALNLGLGFVRDNKLAPGQRYSIRIQGLAETTEGALDKNGLIGGLALLYQSFDLGVGDKIELAYDDGTIVLSPPSRALRREKEPSEETPGDGVGAATVFQKQHLKHLHIEPYAPGSFRSWTPRSEGDIYIVFGALSGREFTDYKYCCGTNKELLRELGYAWSGESKPDAILIERTSNQYLMAEFKMNSRDFITNHKKDDVDVLICWDDDEEDRSLLPRTVLCLKRLIEEAIRDGLLDL